MTELVCLDGTIIRLTASAIWGWGISTPSTPVFANYLDVPITATGTKLAVDGTIVILEIDIPTAMDAATDDYHSTTGGLWFNAPPLSTGADGVVEGVTLTTGLIPSTIFTHSSNGVILDSLSGAFTVAVKTPAKMPTIPPVAPDTTGAPPILDLVPLYPGTWVIQSNGGNTKLKSN